MSYDFSFDDVEFLRSAAGTEALTQAAGLVLTPASLLQEMPTLRANYGDRAAAVVETVLVRRRAGVKLEHADRILATDAALQQATATVVARHRAADIAARHPGAVVHDVTCSIGSELLALTGNPGIGGVIGSDIDPIRLSMADHNLSVSAGVPRVLLRGDALTPTSTADVVLADPARRNARGRTFRFDELVPPLPDLLAAYEGRSLVVKCAPGLDYDLLRERFGFEGQVQVVSLDGGVREACLWSRVDGPQRRATVLRGEGGLESGSFEITSDDPDDIDEPGIGEWIVDPDGAVVRAGLVRHYARRHGLRQLDPQIAYLTGDSVPAGERGFRVIDQLGVTEKVLRAALAAHDCGSLEILVRGLNVDPDQLRKRLKLKGTKPLSLVMTRIGRAGTAFLCEPGLRFPH
ncbi:MAG: class I SAM-dependent methyltransferase [Gordonia sp. (in: high G+C Gram-positive bacteria)]